MNSSFTKVFVAICCSSLVTCTNGVQVRFSSEDSQDSIDAQLVVAQARKSNLERAGLSRSALLRARPDLRQDQEQIAPEDRPREVKLPASSGASFFKSIYGVEKGAAHSPYQSLDWHWVNFQRSLNDKIENSTYPTEPRLHAMKGLMAAVENDRTNNIVLKQNAVREFLRYHITILGEAGLSQHAFVQQYRQDVRRKLSAAVSAADLDASYKSQDIISRLERCVVFGLNAESPSWLSVFAHSNDDNVNMFIEQTDVVRAVPQNLQEIFNNNLKPILTFAMRGDSFLQNIYGIGPDAVANEPWVGFQQQVNDAILNSRPHGWAQVLKFWQDKKREINEVRQLRQAVPLDSPGTQDAERAAVRSYLRNHRKVLEQAGVSLLSGDGSYIAQLRERISLTITDIVNETFGALVQNNSQLPHFVDKLEEFVLFGFKLRLRSDIPAWLSTFASQDINCDMLLEPGHNLENIVRANIVSIIKSAVESGQCKVDGLDLMPDAPPFPYDDFFGRVYGIKQQMFTENGRMPGMLYTNWKCSYASFGDVHIFHLDMWLDLQIRKWISN